jgi:hypothetical protein
MHLLHHASDLGHLFFHIEDSILFHECSLLRVLSPFSGGDGGANQSHDLLFALVTLVS